MFQPGDVVWVALTPSREVVGTVKAVIRQTPRCYVVAYEADDERREVVCARPHLRRCFT